MLVSWLAGSWMGGWMDGKMDRQVGRWGGRERLQGNEDGEQGQSRDCKGHRRSRPSIWQEVELL